MVSDHLGVNYRLTLSLVMPSAGFDGTAGLEHFHRAYPGRSVRGPGRVMAYTSLRGRKPLERASKILHANVINNPQVQEFTSQCAIPKPAVAIQQASAHCCWLRSSCGLLFRVACWLA